MKYILYQSFLVIGLLLVSCADLDELSPRNSIPTDQAITDKASATAAMNGVYSDLQDATLAFDGWLALAQYFSDEMDFTGTFPTRLEFGNLNVFPANGTMAAVFSDLYEVINRANNVIALVPAVEDDNFTTEQRNDFIAQSRFIRAHCYLHLVTLWQEVPLILTPTIDVGEVLNVPKSSVGEIYTQIKDDFSFAEANLATNVGPVVASKQAAAAFLARVALYQGDWATAQAKAIQAVGSAYDLTTVPYLGDQIYSLSFSPTDGNSIAFFYGPAEFGARHSIEPSATYRAAFETGDIRKAASIDEASASVPFGIKYPSFDAANQGAATDPIFFIRHAEMVLIIAEAAAELGDFDTANRWFNQVRLRAGLDPLILDAGNFVDALLQERFVELAMEGPHRLLDLRRKGKALEVLGPIGYDACDNVWPLPQRDIDRNINLQQNSCCNC